MKILLSPAKTMYEADDDFSARSMPALIEDTKVLLEIMQKMTYEELKDMWKCNDKLAKLNEKRIRTMNLYGRISPAVFTYEGLAYKHLAASAMDESALEYISARLRILSGFYGVLRPFDGIVPYRLEMQAVMPQAGSLYDFWGDKLYRQLEDHLIINLASKEYSKAIEPYLTDEDRMINIIFAEMKNGRPVTRATAAKMARGEMVYWMAENRIEDPDELRNFPYGCRYDEERSSENEFVFLAK